MFDFVDVIESYIFYIVDVIESYFYFKLKYLSILK